MNPAKFAVHVMRQQEFTDLAVLKTDRTEARQEWHASKYLPDSEVLRQRAKRLADAVNDLEGRILERGQVTLKQMGLSE